MSKRMTDNDVAAAVGIVIENRSTQESIDAAQALGVECSRARASEAKKDAQIEALADALLRRGVRLLDDGGAWHLAVCPVAASSPMTRAGRFCSEECLEAQAALHLVGRLP